jgi:hypothetical protein
MAGSNAGHYTLKYATNSLRLVLLSELPVRYVFSVVLCALLLAGSTVEARVNPAKYGIAGLDSAALAQGAHSRLQAVLLQHPQWAAKNVLLTIEKPHHSPDRTADFYLLVALVLLLGALRTIHPRYFSNLWRAFYHPTHIPAAVKEQLEGSVIPNVLMNLLFACTAGAYLYCVVRVYQQDAPLNLPPSVLLLSMIAGVAVVYAVKWAVIRFSGWAFGVETITEHYLFNVFLVNKVLAVALLPFIVLLAFSDPAWISPMVGISLILIGILFLVRYARSWQVFGAFFQYSRFHFLAYFCASEILPLAVLTKLLARALFG